MPDTAQGICRAELALTMIEHVQDLGARDKFGGSGQGYDFGPMPCPRACGAVIRIEGSRIVAEKGTSACGRLALLDSDPEL